MSLTHVCQAFNQELQADFAICEIRGTKYVVLHGVDTGTSSSESPFASTRSAEAMAQGLEVIWPLRHGAPVAFSGDSEFITRPMRSFLSAHSIELHPRPVRRHYKTGIIERKHLTLKPIFERIQFENTTASDATILSCATFLSNTFQVHES